ncbi:SHOCT domain-containing protein [Streptomyces avermitilis]|uniref:SHOCT domain-containing protein n=1 Tax=Streptomyces avermitilis TaxID=33903 RepID=UPI0033E98883
MSRRQAGRWAAQDEQQALVHLVQPDQPAAAPAAGLDNRVAQLKELGALRDQGVFSDAEFVKAEGMGMGLLSL